jgi:hypothetical protein
VFAPGSKVYDLVDSREWERVLRACLIQAHVIYTHPLFPILFWHENWIGYPVWVLDLLNEDSGQKDGQLFAHGPTLVLVEASHAVFDRL